MVFDPGRELAHAIVAAQQSQARASASTTTTSPTPTTSPNPSPTFAAPVTLAYYYRPHQIKQVNSGEQQIVYEFTVPPGHIFHIQRIANNWFENTYSLWKVDGITIEERIERFISDINSPLDLKDRYLHSKSNVRWVTVNQSNEAILSEILIDGVVYTVDAWNAVLAKLYS